MKTALVLCAISLALTACQTGYKRIGEGGTAVGYDEALIKPGQYRVTYQEGAGTSPLMAYSGFTRRCAELAQKENAPFFKISDGTQGSTDQWTIGGMVRLPSYTGTCTLSQKDGDGMLNASETLASAVAADKRASEEKAKTLSPNQKPASNPFKTGGS